MLLTMTVESYVDQLRGHEQNPLTLDKILKPFQISQFSEEDHFLEVQTFLQSLLEEFSWDDWIDPTDIASCALSLGYLPAEDFLDRAPTVMTRTITRGYSAKIV